mgnify:CR=1 FL=1
MINLSLPFFPPRDRIAHQSLLSECFFVRIHARLVTKNQSRSSRTIPHGWHPIRALSEPSGATLPISSPTPPSSPTSSPRSTGHNRPPSRSCWRRRGLIDVSLTPPPMRIPKRFARHEARGLGRPHATRTYSCLPPVRTPVCRSALDPDTCSVRIGRVAQLRKPPGDIRRITEMSRRLLRLDAANAPHVAPGPPNTTRPNLSTATILSPRAIFTMPRSTE